jgi:hypothetical protein
MIKERISLFVLQFKLGAQLGRRPASITPLHNFITNQNRHHLASTTAMANVGSGGGYNNVKFHSIRFFLDYMHRFGTPINNEESQTEHAHRPNSSIPHRASIRRPGHSTQLQRFGTPVNEDSQTEHTHSPNSSIPHRASIHRTGFIDTTRVSGDDRTQLQVSSFVHQETRRNDKDYQG